MGFTQRHRVVLSKNDSTDEARFAEVIVTGWAEYVQQLENAEWIFALIIGQSIYIRPYRQLEKGN
ncbi:hypothetical protein ACVR1I_02645 [Streptococcus cameli]